MYIVTGGAGFIGSCFVKKLNDHGITDIIIVDKMNSSEKWKNLRNLKYKEYQELETFKHTMSRYSLYDRVVDKSVWHFGACSDTTVTDSAYMMDNNYKFSCDLYDWSIRNGFRFVYASSAATYGAREDKFIDDTTDIYNLRPLNAYGYSKHLFDTHVLQNKGFSKHKAIGLKFFNVFGPNEYHKGDMRSIICKKYSEIKNTKQITLFKSYRLGYTHGDQQRDFIYIKDALNILIKIALNKKIAGGLYNIGSGIATTWNEVAISMYNAIYPGRRPVIKYIEMPEKLKGKYQYYTKADITKLKLSGLLCDFTPIQESVKDYIVNYIDKDNYL